MDRSKQVRRVLTLAAVVALAGAACTQDDGNAAPTDAGTSDDIEVLGSEGEGYRATIRRTEGGVAHITADDIDDVAFGQGWASGEDRACDLADQVLKVNGERARWLGAGEEDENIESDLAWRSIGIRAIAEQDWATASQEVRDLMSAYTAGWNAHLEEVGVDDLGDWCAGRDWLRPLQPVEVYAYGRSIALNASGSAVAGLIATAQPPGADDAATTATPTAWSGSPAIEPVLASNGWAIGSERSQAAAACWSPTRTSPGRDSCGSGRST